jgi:hydrogenase nickel incorporation protein HypA/HybF
MPVIMHELAVTEQILDLAEHHAAEAGGHVTDLYLVIGELSTIVDDSIQFYWDIISQGTACAGAQLHFARIPARLQCRDCGGEYGLANGLLTVCPVCGHGRVDILAGQEFRLESLEIAGVVPSEMS